MKILEQLATSLPIFFGELPEQIRPLPEIEKQINDEIAAYLVNNPESRPPCARMRYHGASCGFADSGSTAYVVNARNDRSVRATVRVRWEDGTGSGQFDRVFKIPAGSESLVGCTRGQAGDFITYSFAVVGCEIV